MSNPIRKQASDRNVPGTNRVTDMDSKLAEEHQDLYGMLLIANYKLENIGTLVIWIMFLFVVAACVTIHMRWLDPILGIPVDQLRGWGVYVLIAIATFVIYCLYNVIREKMVYRKVLPPILNYLNKHQLSFAWLVAQLDDDAKLRDLAKQVKNDTSSAAMTV